MSPVDGMVLHPGEFGTVVTAELTTTDAITRESKQNREEDGREGQGGRRERERERERETKSRGYTARERKDLSEFNTA
jgi:hypothetical protein